MIKLEEVAKVDQSEPLLADDVPTNGRFFNGRFFNGVSSASASSGSLQLRQETLLGWTPLRLCPQQLLLSEMSSRAPPITCSMPLKSTSLQTISLDARGRSPHNAAPRLGRARDERVELGRVYASTIREVGATSAFTTHDGRDGADQLPYVQTLVLLEVMTDTCGEITLPVPDCAEQRHHIERAARASSARRASPDRLGQTRRCEERAADLDRGRVIRRCRSHHRSAVLS